MKINKSENIDCFDVDETLIMHERADTIPSFDQVLIRDYVTHKLIVARINRPMVRLLKESHARGFHVRVWSRGGWRWALAVVQALGLEPYVTDVETKPSKYFDDKPVQEWLSDRVYISPNTAYKPMATKQQTKEK